MGAFWEEIVWWLALLADLMADLLDELVFWRTVSVDLRAELTAMWVELVGLTAEIFQSLLPLQSGYMMILAANVSSWVRHNILVCAILYVVWISFYIARLTEWLQSSLSVSGKEHGLKLATDYAFRLGEIVAIFLFVAIGLLFCIADHGHANESTKCKSKETSS
jgi:hypothetical protein